LGAGPAMTTWASGALVRVMGKYGDMTYLQGRTCVANGLNQYASVGGTAFSYDGRGNLTSDGARLHLRRRQPAAEGGADAMRAFLKLFQ
jgi:hypothetical protein